MNMKELLEYRDVNMSSLYKLVNEVMRQYGRRADPNKIRVIVINKL